jgi:hypothetical protein
MTSVRSRAGIRAAVAALVIALALSLAACGSSSSAGSGGSSSGSAASTTGTVHLAKTKFVLHAGLAFGAFHRYIWKPARRGDFSHPFSHKLTIVKAGLAGAFVYHEVKLALTDARASPTLSKLVAPLTALENRVHALGNDIKHGDTSTLAEDNSSIGSIEKQSAGAGQPIQEQAPSSV